MAEKPTEFGGGRPDLDTVKQWRREQPSGWMELAKDPSRALLIDSLLDAPPGYEFSPPEIAPRAGVSAQSVRNHLEILIDRGLVEEVGSSRYRVNDHGRVMVELRELNSAVTAVRTGMASQRDEYIDPDELTDNARKDKDEHDTFGGPPNGMRLANAD